ncbi:MAG: SDR family oxidoreductase [archaeon]|nr:SDR family oxidoreductase [archaeon]
MEDNKEKIDKKILVTGASSGIGRSVAFYFLNKGYQVALVGQDTASMKEMCTKNHFKNAVIFALDLVKDIQVFDLKSSVVEVFQTIDVIVNCAGVNIDGDVEKTFPQELDYSMDINVRANFIIIKNLSKFLKKGASIINISCLYGHRPMCGMISGCMSKAGLEALTRYAAAELAAQGVRVNAIAACPVETNIMRLLRVSENEINLYREKMAKYIPMGRIAKPDDIVKVVDFLASPRSKRITGQVIRVDGGRGLTSSGYVHYKGCRNMNSRFEPDGVTMNSWFDDIKKKFVAEKPEDIPTDPEKLSKFIDEKLAISNFSTRDSDAHISINANYKIVDNNDDNLKDKFLDKEQQRQFDENVNIKSSQANRFSKDSYGY